MTTCMDICVHVCLPPPMHCVDRKCHCHCIGRASAAPSMSTYLCRLSMHHIHVHSTVGIWEDLALYCVRSLLLKLSKTILVTTIQSHYDWWMTFICEILAMVYSEYVTVYNFGCVFTCDSLAVSRFSVPSIRPHLVFVSWRGQLNATVWKPVSATAQDPAW